MQKENFEFISAKTGYAFAGINETKKSDYSQVFDLDGDVIHAHASSCLEVNFKNEAFVQGGLNGDVNPRNPISFYVNGLFVGKLRDNKQLCRPVKVQGNCLLEAIVDGNVCAHSLWRVINAKQYKPKKIGVCACLIRDTDTKDFIIKEYKKSRVNICKCFSNSGEETLDKCSKDQQEIYLFVDDNKSTDNVAVRINQQIQKAIDQKCDSIVVVDPRAVINDFFIESLTTDQTFTVAFANGVSHDSFEINRYSLLYDTGTESVISAPIESWIACGGFKPEYNGISENIKNIIKKERYVVKYNSVFPLVIFKNCGKIIEPKNTKQYEALKKTEDASVVEEIKEEAVKAVPKKRKVKKNEKANNDD